MTLADKIAALRKQSAWSQEELAERLDVSRQSVSKWESGASMPELDKIVKISEIFGVSTDFLLKDEPEQVACAESSGAYAENRARSVSLEEATDFMDLTRRHTKGIAFAILLAILSPVCLILLGGLSEYGTLPLTSDMAGGLGVTVLLVLAAVSVGILILSGMRLSPYEYLEKEEISLQWGVQEIVEKRKADFEPVYRRSIALGVVACILGVVPMMLAAAFSAQNFVYVCCTGVLLVFIALGVYLLVWSGNIHSSYQKLLQMDDYTLERKETGRRAGFFSGAYWCVVTAIYLAVSLPKNNWSSSWVIWPVAGVLFAALYNLLNATRKSKS